MLGIPGLKSYRCKHFLDFIGVGISVNLMLRVMSTRFESSALTFEIVARCSVSLATTFSLNLDLSFPKPSRTVGSSKADFPLP